MPRIPQRVIRRADGKYFAAPDRWVARIEDATDFNSAAEAAATIAPRRREFDDCVLLLRYDSSGKGDVELSL